MRLEMTLVTTPSVTLHSGQEGSSGQGDMEEGASVGSTVSRAVGSVNSRTTAGAVLVEPARLSESRSSHANIDRGLRCMRRPSVQGAFTLLGAIAAW